MGCQAEFTELISPENTNEKIELSEPKSAVKYVGVHHVKIDQPTYSTRISNRNFMVRNRILSASNSLYNNKNVFKNRTSK